ncbi:MAG: hypothetical protein ACRDYA_03010 [Egibacteraceae bacterium]
MVDVDRVSEPEALANHLDEVADTLEALWLGWDGGQDYDLAIWQGTVDALMTGRMLLVTSLDVADRGVIADVAELLRQASGYVRNGQGEPTLPPDWTHGAERIREAVVRLRALA